MPLPTSGRLWKLVKAAVRASEFIMPTGSDYLEGLLADSASVTNPYWVRWSVRWSQNSPVGTTDDKGQFKLDIMNITATTVDSSWTAGDFSTCKTAIETF